jgi:hypothetical protein
MCSDPSVRILDTKPPFSENPTKKTIHLSALRRPKAIFQKHTPKIERRQAESGISLAKDSLQARAIGKAFFLCSNS